MADPLAEEYFLISPYTYVDNNPLIYIDPDGQRIVIAGDDNFQKQVWAYMFSLAMRSETGFETLKKVIEHDETFFIYSGKKNKVKDPLKGEGRKGEVYGTFELSLEEAKKDKDGAPGSVEATLGHELSHFLMRADSPYLSEYKDGPRITDKFGDNVSPEEVGALERENSIRKELGISERKSYSGLDFYGKEIGKNEKYSGYHVRDKKGEYAPVIKGKFTPQFRAEYLSNNVKTFVRKNPKTYKNQFGTIKAPGVLNQKVYEKR